MILFCKSGCADVTEIFPYFGAWGQGKSNEDKFSSTLTIALKFWKERKATSTKLCELESAYGAGMMCALGAWVLHCET